jgi:hypothetical protein
MQTITDEQIAGIKHANLERAEIIKRVLAKHTMPKKKDKVELVKDAKKSFWEVSE